MPSAAITRESFRKRVFLARFVFIYLALLCLLTEVAIWPPDLPILCIKIGLDSGASGLVSLSKDSSGKSSK